MVDDVPFDVVDFPETGDLSDQTGGDVIDAARQVRFKIEKVEPRVNEKDGVKLTARLNVRASIGPLGVDGNGKYAKKNLFVELLTWHNKDVYTSDWWNKQARFPYKSFLKALDFDVTNPPKVTDQWLSELKGREFTADIRKEEIRVDSGEVTAEGKKKYVASGDFKNTLTNFKRVE